MELTSSAISAEVNSTTVRELPFNGRDWSSLAILQPGVLGIRSQLGTTGSVNRGNRGFGNQLTTDGHRPSENTYRINGINVNDYSNGSPGSVAGNQLGRRRDSGVFRPDHQLLGGIWTNFGRGRQRGAEVGKQWFPRRRLLVPPR